MRFERVLKFAFHSLLECVLFFLLSTSDFVLSAVVCLHVMHLFGSWSLV